MTIGIDERVALLERTSRRWRLVSILAILMAAFAGAEVVHERWAVKTKIQAREFALVDDSGQVSARLLNSSGGASLFLNVTAPEGRVVVGYTGESLGLAVLQRDDPRINLTIGTEGNPSLGISAQHGGKSKVMFGIDDRAEGNSHLGMQGPEGNAHFLVLLNKTQTLSLSEQDGKDLFAVRGTDGGVGDPEKR